MTARLLEHGDETLVRHSHAASASGRLRQQWRKFMLKFAFGAGLLVALTVPALATSSSTTTTTTTGGSTTTTEQYYVVRDPSTKRCTVTTSKPSGGTTVVVGDTIYKSRNEAETAVTKVCTN
jgi:hypothetical protein